jgi:hypothetical protein
MLLSSSRFIPADKCEVQLVYGLDMFAPSREAGGPAPFPFCDGYVVWKAAGLQHFLFILP